MARIDPNKLTLEERVVQINRVAKVVKGGRRFSFSAIVVVGDGAGHVGVGLGKAGEVPESIRKGVEDAKKNIIRIPMVGTTIPHEVRQDFGASRIMLKPASQGTGVIAGGAVRAVVEAAGIRDILAKVFGSTNPVNVTRATLEALRSLHSAEELSARRGVRVRSAVAGQPAAGGWQWPVSCASPRPRARSATSPAIAARSGRSGLHGIGDTVEVPDNEATRGMVRQVRFLVTVEELPEPRRSDEVARPSPGRRQPQGRAPASAVASPPARARPPDAARRVRSRAPAARSSLGSRVARPRSTSACRSCAASGTCSGSSTRS